VSIFAKISSVFVEKEGSLSNIKINNISAEKLAAAALMVEVALQDGQFDASERSAIEKSLTQKLNLSIDDAKELLELAEDKQNQSVQILSFTKEIKNHFDNQGRAHIMEMLWEVVFSDGEEDNYESNLMRRIAGLLYISDKESGDIRKKVMRDLNLL